MTPAQVRKMTGCYTVVENAGYEGECDVRTWLSFEGAVKWRDRHYTADEIETMHVAIARDISPTERTYEI
jgi:hypothetical protein